MRIALGCPRSRLLLPWLVQGATIAIFGMILGCVVAWRSAPLLLVDLADTSIARTMDFNSLPEFTAPGFVLALICAIFIIVPCSVRTLNVTVESATKSSGRTARSSAVSSMLLSSQVMVSVLLATSAVLFVESLLNLQRVRSGYDEDNRLLFSVDPQLSGYKGNGLMTFYNNLERRLVGIPGVRSATGFRYSPGNPHGATYLDLLDGSAIQTVDHEVGENLVGADFASTLGMQLLHGRDIGDRDIVGAPLVVVVNESFAGKFFPNTNPVGRQISFIWTKGSKYEIVGVVRDAKDAGLHQPIARMVYLAYKQNPASLGPLTFVVRTHVAPLSTMGSVRREVATTDPTVAISDLHTLRESLQAPLFRDRVLALTAVLLAALAMGLVSLGIFALLENIVISRTREIGVQMALGATASQIVHSISRSILLSTVIGILGGVSGSYVILKYLATIFFGVRGYDIVAAALVGTAVLLVVSGSAGFPLMKAIRTDPAIALRYE